MRIFGGRLNISKRARVTLATFRWFGPIDVHEIRIDGRSHVLLAHLTLKSRVSLSFHPPVSTKWHKSERGNHECVFRFILLPIEIATIGEKVIYTHFCSNRFFRGHLFKCKRILGCIVCTLWFRNLWDFFKVIASCLYVQLKMFLVCGKVIYFKWCVFCFQS